MITKDKNPPVSPKTDAHDSPEAAISESSDPHAPPDSAHPTSVHTQETTDTFSYPSTYRSYLASKDQPEMDATELAYLAFSIERDHDYLAQLQSCRTASWFARNTTTNLVTLLNNACRLRWCPLCARARQYAIRLEVKNWISDLVKPKFFTLTLKHSDAPLSDQIDRLYQSFRKLRKIKYFSSRIRGGCWFFQIKRTSGGLDWHPHLHCILDSEYIPHKWLAAKWEEITKDSRIVDIRILHNQDKAADYVARYAAKPAQLSKFIEPDRVEIINALHGRRLCGSWGSGQSLSFRPRKIGDKSDWINVGSWSSVTSQMMTSPQARAIMHAWQLDQELDPRDTLIQSFSLETFSQAVRKEKALWILEPYFPQIVGDT